MANVKGNPTAIHACKKCGRDFKWNVRHDARYCPECDAWAEAKCDDPKCDFCSDRPERPSQEPQTSADEKGKTLPWTEDISGFDRSVDPALWNRYYTAMWASFSPRFSSVMKELLTGLDSSGKRQSDFKTKGDNQVFWESFPKSTSSGWPQFGARTGNPSGVTEPKKRVIIPFTETTEERSGYYFIVGRTKLLGYGNGSDVDIMVLDTDLPDFESIVRLHHLRLATDSWDGAPAGYRAYKVLPIDADVVLDRPVNVAVVPAVAFYEIRKAYISALEKYTKAQLLALSQTAESIGKKYDFYSWISIPFTKEFWPGGSRHK